MRSWVIVSLAALCALLAAGCPYSSNAPIAKPGGVPLDGRLIGEWVGTVANGDSIRITVFPFNENEYYAEMTEKNGETTRLRAFAFDLGGEQFLEINDVDGSPDAGEYLFARCTFSGDATLAIRIVGDAIIPEGLATEPEGLRDFLLAHQKDPALDDKEASIALVRRD